jgi:hypothetical protein
MRSVSLYSCVSAVGAPGFEFLAKSAGLGLSLSLIGFIFLVSWIWGGPLSAAVAVPLARWLCAPQFES